MQYKKLEDIARELKISTATISRTLNKHTEHLVKEETRNRIYEFIKHTGFKPNLKARGLATGKLTDLFLVISQNEDSIFYDQYFFNIMRGIQDVIIGTEYSLNILTIDNDFTHDQIYDILMNQETAGLILSPYCSYLDFPFDVVKDYKCPIITLDSSIASKNAYSVRLDHLNAGYKGAQHLWENGYRNFTIISDARRSLHSTLRKQGFYRFLSEKNESDYDVVNFEHILSHVSAVSALQEVLKNTQSPVGVFALSDEIATGMINNLHRHTGLECPKDIGILGFDGLRMGQYTVPPLSSVAFPFREIGRIIAHVLIRAIGGKKTERTHTVQASVTDGGSC